MSKVEFFNKYLDAVIKQSEAMKAVSLARNESELCSPKPKFYTEAELKAKWDAIPNPSCKLCTEDTICQYCSPTIRTYTESEVKEAVIKGLSKRMIPGLAGHTNNIMEELNNLTTK